MLLSIHSNLHMTVKNLILKITLFERLNLCGTATVLDLTEAYQVGSWPVQTGRNSVAIVITVLRYILA